MLVAAPEHRLEVQRRVTLRHPLNKAFVNVAAISALQQDMDWQAVHIGQALKLGALLRVLACQ